MYIVVLVSSLLAASLALALAREARLRRALQRLLAKILHHWRTAHESRPSSDSSRAEREPVGAAVPGRRVDAVHDRVRPAA
jgi:hypothetical protein